MGFYSERVLVLAHRGALRHAPENTLPAFKLALDQGADGAELDVTLSADGEVVVIHDDDLARTTDGRGLVADKTLAQLKALDAGRWFDPQFENTRIPTLDEVLAELPPNTRLNIELKALMHPARSDLPARVWAVVRNHNALNRVLFSSFSPWALQQIRKVGAPPAHLAFLLLNQPFSGRVIGWLGQRIAPFETVHPWRGQLDQALMVRCQARGWAVNPWFGAKESESAEDTRALMQMGVSAIITNQPLMVSAVVAKGE